MDFKRSIFLFVFILTAAVASAQSFTLSGKVSDDDGNAIELATISCLE
jgi:hypothetical protein